MAQADLVEQGLKAGAPGAARALEELVKRATKPEEKARVAGLRAQLPQQGKKPGGKGGTEIGVSTAGHSDEFTPPPGYDMRIDKVNEDAKRETQEANYRTLISALMYAKTPEARAVIKNKAEQDVANGEITDAQMRLILSEYTGREYRGRR
jgi:hypothetical protein